MADNRVAEWFPGVATVSRYERGWLARDALAGITVGAYLVPQVMAYAEVAGLPPVAGLWAVVGAMAVYAVLGTSRHLSVGPESTTSLMTAAAVGSLAGGDERRYAALVIALTLIVAAVFAVAWVARLGFLADLLSKPVLVGYLAGVAVIMVAGQLDSFAGVADDTGSPPRQIWHFLTRLDEVHAPTLGLAGAVLAFLFLGSWRLPRFPVPLLAIVGAASAVKLLDLGADGVVLIGSVPSGLPRPELPTIGRSEVASLVPPALGVAVLSYTDSALYAREFGGRGGYQVDQNRELLALGAANVAAGVMQGFPVSGSGSRTVIGFTLGARTQVFSLVAVGVVVLTLLFAAPVLETFPEAALAAVVMWAAVKLVDLAELRRIARFRVSELVLALATTVAVLVVDILYGVLIAVGLSVLDLVRRVARPHDGVLGYVPGMAGMHDISDYPDARQVPGLMVYRYDAPLFFANAEHFRRRALASLSAAEGPVEWVVLNFEANVHVDLTSVDALDSLREELEARGITLALARVKNEMHRELEQVSLLRRIGPDRVFPTLPTAVAAYVEWYEHKHGHPPEGIDPPKPPEPPGFEHAHRSPA